MRRYVLACVLAAGCATETPSPTSHEDVYARATLEFLAGNYARAAHLYEQALAVTGVAQRADVLAQIGKCRLGAGDAAAAVDAFSLALANDPPPALSAEIHYRRSGAYNALWRPEEALSDLRRVADAPRDVREEAVRTPEFLYRLALTTLRAGDWDGGRRLLLDVVAKFPLSREALDAKDRLALTEFRIQIARMRDPHGIKGDPLATSSGDYLVLTGRYARFADAVADLDRVRAEGFPDAFVIP